MTVITPRGQVVHCHRTLDRSAKLGRRTPYVAALDQRRRWSTHRQRARRPRTLMQSRAGRQRRAGRDRQSILNRWLSRGAKRPVRCRAPGPRLTGSRRRRCCSSIVPTVERSALGTGSRFRRSSQTSSTACTEEWEQGRAAGSLCRDATPTSQCHVTECGGDTQRRRRVRLPELTRRALLIAAATDSPASNVLRSAITSRWA